LFTICIAYIYIDFFLIFSYKILKPYFLKNFRVDPWNPGPGPLAGSTSRPGLITMQIIIFLILILLIIIKIIIFRIQIIIFIILIIILNFIIIYSNNFKKNINVNNNNNNNNNNCYYCFSFFFSARSTDPTVWVCNP
jgi:hypothetical protein